MSLSGKINVDFQILRTSDPKVLLVADTSDWKHIEDKVSVVKVTLPGSTSPVYKNFKKHNVNIFNSSILGVTPKACTAEDLKDLPDGIYTIEVVGSPNTFNKKRYYLRTEKLQLKLDMQYAALGLDLTHKNSDSRENLLDIDLMIRAAEAALRVGDISKASTYYKEAKSIFDSYVNCENCN